VLACHGVQDPGNLGTLLRTALTFGVKEVVLGKGCADLYAPKTIRATSGVLGSLTVVTDLPTEELLTHCATHGIPLWALDPEAKNPLPEKVPGGVLLLGSEGQGLLGLPVPNSSRFYLPGVSNEPSLNVAQAATLGLYLLWGGRG
jgi:TrmH family RNA methyltransferase